MFGGLKIKIIVGSLNPVKVSAVESAFSDAFNLESIKCVGLAAVSQVADQPLDSEETKLGAENRVRYCRDADKLSDIKADYYVAMEGGVDHFDHGPATFAYIAIANQAQISIGRSAILPLPKVVYSALLQGEELGDVMDRLFGTKNIKQKGGAIGLLTHGKATRESIYTQAILLALAPFLNPELFQRV